MAALQQIKCNISHSCQKSELRSWLRGAKQKWRDASQVTKEMHNKSIGSIEISKERGSLKGESEAFYQKKRDHNLRLLAKNSRTMANYKGEICREKKKHKHWWMWMVYISVCVYVGGCYCTVWQGNCGPQSLVLPSWGHHWQLQCPAELGLVQLLLVWASGMSAHSGPLSPSLSLFFLLFFSWCKSSPTE